MLRFRYRRQAIRWAAAALAACTLVGQAAAQAVGPADPRAEFEVLFQRTLHEPANLDAAFRFAEVATKLGDYEAAIGALERMTFYNPNLPRVKLELGVLYFRLGSYEMARSYFEAAAAAPDVPSDIRARVASFIAEIDRRTAVTQWSFFAQAGLRHQSNATAGPSSPYVRAYGFDAILDRQFVRQPDWNAFGLAALRHVYDFENQRGDVWETTVASYYASQFKYEKLNLGLIEIQTGPRLALAPDFWPGLSFRPYVLANAVSLGDYPYLTSFGSGAAVTVPVGRLMTLEPFVEVRQRRFETTRDYLNANEQTGRLWVAGVLAQGEVWGPTLRWQSRLAFSRNDTRRDYTSYEQVSFDAAFPIEFDGPWGGTRKWSLIPTVGYARTYYDGPNAIVDPVVKRVDREWRAGAILDTQIHEWLGLSAQINYSIVDSSLRNYNTRNLSVVFGPTVRF